MIANDPEKVAGLIGSKFFPKASPAVILDSVRRMADGAVGDGGLNGGNIAVLLRYTAQSGDVAPKNNAFWTNSYVEAAAK